MIRKLNEILLPIIILNCGLISGLKAETDPGGGHPQLPYISLTNAANGDVVPFPFTITATATNSVSSAVISNVGFYVDGGYWGGATSEPYSFQAYMGTGFHTIMARAIEPRRNEYGLSYLVNVAVGTSFPPAPPQDQWQSDILAPGAGKMPNLAIDGNDGAHTAYISNNRLYYAKWSGAAWQSEIVLNDASQIKTISLAVEANGNPHVVYVQNQPYLNVAYHAEKAGGWAPEIVSSGTVSGVSIAVDPFNNVRIAITRNQPYASELRYASKTGPDWTSVLVDSHGWVFEHPSLAFDSSGNPRIAFDVRDHHQPNSSELRLAIWAGYWPSFHILEAVPYGPIGQISLVVSKSGTPYIAFISGDHNLVYAYKYDNGNANNWAMELVEPAVSASGASLALTSAGQPMLAYLTGSTLKLAKRISNFWYKEDATVTTGGLISMKLGSNDSPVVVYESPGDNSIRYAKITGSSPMDLLISNVSAGGISFSSATIQWTTNLPSDSRVEYGPGSFAGGQSTTDPAIVTDHRIVLNGLSSATVYHFRVLSQDTTGHLAASGDNTFTTLIPADTTPPSVMILSPSSGAAVAANISIQGTAMDNDRVARVDVQVDAAAFAIASGTASWTYALNTLSLANGYHNLRARALDARGNSQTVSIGIIVNNQAPDTTPPSLFILSPASGTALSGNVTISGTAADNLGLLKVEVRVDTGSYSLASGLTDWTFALDTRILSTGPHVITARATDGSGNSGAQTVPVKFQAVPPINLSNIAASDVGSRSAQISWATDKPGNSQVQYGLTSGYGSASPISDGPSTSHSVPIGGLTPNTTYHFRAFSKEPGGDLSASTDFTFKTAKKNITNLMLLQGSLILSWNYDIDDSFAEFLIYRTTFSYPAGGQGNLIYRGTASRYEDFDVIPGRRYFYAVLVQSKTGNWAGDPGCISAIAGSKDTRISSLWKIVSSGEGDSVNFFDSRIVTIPPKSLPGDTEISILDVSPESSGVDLQKLKEMGYVPVGNFMDLGPNGFQFPAPVSVVFSYDPSQLSGAVENDLKVASWHTSVGNWEILSPQIDAANHRATAQTSHFSIYGVVAKIADTAFQLGNNYVFPNPAIQKSKVRFHLEAGSADEMHLRIYNDVGEQIREATLTGPVSLNGKLVFEYDLDMGQLPSGTYHYVAQARKQGFNDLLIKDKLAIIK